MPTRQVRILSSMVAAPLFLLLGACTASTDDPRAQGDTPITAFAGTPITSGFSGKCLDDRYDATTDGNPVQLYACNGTPAQSWQYTNGTLVGPSGKCLTVTPDAQTVGARVVLSRCWGTAAQKWTVTGSALKSTSGLCLGLANGSGDNSTPTELAACDGSTDQIWRVGMAPPSNTRSIREWATCDGTTDDALAVAKAIAAAKDDAFTLVVDCPVYMHVGSDRTRPVFIDNGTTVTFEGAGKLIVDNVLEPAFAIMNSSHITLTNWKILYTGIMPVVGPVGTGPGGQWSDVVATAWLRDHRGVTGGNSLWQGLVNTSALFYIAGASSNITVRGLEASAFSVTEGYRFIPCVFAIAVDWKDNQAVTTATASALASPSGLTFDNIVLDGTIMGWVGGGLTDSVFSNITSKHYSDLQDASGNNSGGVGKWFAPPHLFYLSDSSIVGNNANLTFTNIIDAPTPISATSNGDRVGVARDTSAVGGSGVIYSLKLSCHNCTVNGYTSNRPDGLMDALELDNVTIENVTATYNSQFTNGVYPGVRFPRRYNGLTFKNMTITDVATTSSNQPIGSSGGASALLFDNVNLFVNSIEPGVTLYGTNGFQDPNSLRTYFIKSTSSVFKVGPNGRLP